MALFFPGTRLNYAHSILKLSVAKLDQYAIKLAVTRRYCMAEGGQEGSKFCAVGNPWPTIPTFEVKPEGKTRSLGELPFATEEAEWVSYILGCKPMATLHEQAIESVAMMTVSCARMIQIATHGSAALGFLAFAGLHHTSDPVDESSVLIYPEDIEKMVLAPALVVLSSCDSGRGAPTVKADGVLGMARAFILAGAQAIMTTLVPDESAAVFMKFFYRYLVDGHPASISLQEAILSIRSFRESPEYKAVQEHFGVLAAALDANSGAKKDLLREFKSKGWFKPAAKPDSDRMICVALDKIRADVKHYEEFIGMLKSQSELNHITIKITGITSDSI